jgi:hypothetical protein
MTGNQIGSLIELVEQAELRIKQRDEAEEAERKVRESIEISENMSEFVQHLQQEWKMDSNALVKLVSGHVEGSTSFPHAWLSFEFEGATVNISRRADNWYILRYPVTYDAKMETQRIAEPNLDSLANALATIRDRVREYVAERKKIEAAPVKQEIVSIPGPWVVKADLPAAKLQDTMNDMEAHHFHVRNILNDGGGEYSSRYTVVGHICDDHDGHTSTEDADTTAPVQ